MSKRMAWLAVGLAAWATGCYRYVPAEDVRPGAEVRARLGTEAAVRRSAGRDAAIMQIDGRVIDRTDDAITIDVLVARSTSAFQDIVIRDTVRVERAEIASLMEREFSPTRSAAAFAGGALGVFLVVRGITTIFGGDTLEDNGGGPTVTVVPHDRGRRRAVFRITIPAR
jgi:hypothetical protein